MKALVPTSMSASFHRLAATAVLCSLGWLPSNALAASAKPLHARGVVKSVDPAKHTLAATTDKAGKHQEVFSWDDHTRFTEHGQKATATTLQAGQHVQIEYTRTGQQAVAQQIHIGPASKAKHTTKTTK